MELTIHYLYSFDLGMDLELTLQQRSYCREILRLPEAGEVFYEGQRIGTASAVASIYPFGIGMLEVTFALGDDLEMACALSVAPQKVYVGRYSLGVFCNSKVEEVVSRARTFSRKIYSDRSEAGEEVFPLVVARSKADLDVDAYMKKHKKHLFGIVTGEPSYARLSDYALTKEELKNVGYYEDDLILINRFGAFLHTREEETLKGLITLAVAQYAHVRAANLFLERSLLKANKALEEQPMFYHFWKIPGAYQRLAAQQNAFAKAKVNLVESLNLTQGQFPEIESDWHLRSVHKEILAALDLNDQSKMALTRLETIDTIYSHLAEYHSTVFFIFLDFVFFTWLLVDLGGWAILLFKMK
ncbi:MAG: hypothetical protein AABZ44_08455 [Elusimicrobiota bacterium]